MFTKHLSDEERVDFETFMADFAPGLEVSEQEGIVAYRASKILANPGPIPIDVLLRCMAAFTSLRMRQHKMMHGKKYNVTVTFTQEEVNGLRQAVLRIISQFVPEQDREAALNELERIVTTE